LKIDITTLAQGTLSVLAAEGIDGGVIDICQNIDDAHDVLLERLRIKDELNDQREQGKAQNSAGYFEHDFHCEISPSVDA